MGSTARTIFLTLSVALASCAVAKAEADIYSANAVLPGCKALRGFPNPASGMIRISDRDQGYCAGLIDGIAWVMRDNSDLGAGCAHYPKGVSLGQQIQVVIHYIEARPNRLHESFNRLVVEALIDAWPCRDAKVVPPPHR
jgi:Rap1a immunity proteins